MAVMERCIENKSDDCSADRCVCQTLPCIVQSIAIYGFKRYRHIFCVTVRFIQMTCEEVYYVMLKKSRNPTQPHILSVTINHKTIATIHQNARCFSRIHTTTQINAKQDFLACSLVSIRRKNS